MLVQILGELEVRLLRGADKGIDVGKCARDRCFQVPTSNLDSTF